MAGLIHVYCGDGKGKTTASVGLTVRAAGAGKQVVFAQFYKDGSSSEIAVLKQLANVSVLVCETHYGLFRRMTDEQKEAARRDYTALLERAIAAAEHAELLVLDESVSACNHGAIPEERLLDFLQRKPEGLEVVLTGRSPSERLLALADYVTRMGCEKHPFTRGSPARRGIEF